MWWLDVRAYLLFCFFFFQAEDGIRDLTVTGVQTCALPICLVVRSRKTPRNSVLRAVQMLNEAGAPLAGVILNLIPRSGGGYGYYYYDSRSEERRVGKEGRSRWSPYH